MTRILPSPDALADAVATALCERVAEAQQEGRIPDVALTGGTIAAKIHDRLAALGASSAVDWGRVQFWWGDERFVPAASDERNARDVVPLLRGLGVPEEHVHPMPAADSGLSLPAAAAAYAARLREEGGGEFEVVMLGIGPDGHVASLFPGSAEVGAEVGALTHAVTGSPKPPPERVSLSLEALNRARAVWFVASGAAKAGAVAAAQAPGPVAEVPARGVRGRLETLWWLDAEAAAAD